MILINDSNPTDQHLHRLASESLTTIMAAATTTGSIMEMAVASKTGSRRVGRALSSRFSPFPPFFFILTVLYKFTTHILD